MMTFNDINKLLQKQARSHATKTGVHHLKNGVHHFYTIQKCTVWPDEKSSIFRVYNNFIYEPIFKNFVALFTTFVMQKYDTSIFVCGCFRTR